MAKGYSFAALVDVLYPVYKTSLGNGANLNDFNSLDHVGVYVQVSDSYAAGGSNYPEPHAGCLEVLPSASGVIQRYTVYTWSNATYVRSNYSGTWSAWKMYLTDNIIYNMMYPVGICIQFDANVNPNTTFPGTTWAQIVDGRQVRAAENAAAIGTTGGSDTVVLAEANLPAHTHTVATHSHTIATHSHTIAQHDHLVDSHAHKMTHGHTASSVADGAHTHFIANSAPDTGDSRLSPLLASNHLMISISPDRVDRAGYRLRGSPQTSDRGLTSSAGSHAHTITVGDMSGDTGVASPRTNTAGATATGTGGPTATGTGGPSDTGSVGSGTAVAVAGAWHKYAIWKRTA